MPRTTPCLWFDTQAEEAANFYVSVFPNARITGLNHYTEGLPMPAGTVLTVQFELDGQAYMALNGGPHFQFNPSVSLVIYCDTQAEIDHYWHALSALPEHEQCGWLVDKYGLSWQVVPRDINTWLVDSEPARTQRILSAVMGMKKLDIAALQRAFDGQ